MKKLLAFIIAFTAIAGIAAISFFGLDRGSPDRDIKSNLIGKTTYDFELPVYERYQAEYGPSFKLSDYRGKPVVLNFWATWCISCLQEAPILENAWRHYKDEALFVGVQTLEKGKDAAGNDFLSRFNLSFPNIKDSKNNVSIDYGIFGLPETFFIDAEGKVFYKHAGPLTESIIAEKLEEMLQ